MRATTPAPTRADVGAVAYFISFSTVGAIASTHSA